MPDDRGLFKPVQALCNFLHIDQSTFYGALRKLHSVINIPEPEDADKSPLRFFHASFQDFLADTNRSRVYHIARTKAIAEVIKSTLFWNEFDSVHFHSAQGVIRYESDTCQHSPLPNLKWALAQNEEEISKEIIEYSSFGNRLWRLHSYLTSDMDDFWLSSKIRNLDFRYIRIPDSRSTGQFVAWLYAQARSDGTVRTEPVDEIDQRLLSYLDMILDSHPRRPASLSSIKYDWGESLSWRSAEYVFLGKGFKTIIICIETGLGVGSERVIALNADKEPSRELVKKLRRRLCLSDDGFRR
ncbi:hypothetical protein AN958_05814 [Leucoagaricus sp. SymC.cos]|nr:hypothetical protein AN958_05814 [Leucoagaricus sp. SymC.cos]